MLALIGVRYSQKNKKKKNIQARPTASEQEVK